MRATDDRLTLGDGRTLSWCEYGPDGGRPDWDFDPSAIRASVIWWYGERDANAPISAVHRLLSRIPSVELRLWTDAGHLASYHRHDEIVDELLSR